jgi:hypothetical protein
MSTGAADSHEGCVRLGCHKQKFQVPRLARNIHFSAVQGRKVNVSYVPPWDTEHAGVPLPVAGGYRSRINFAGSSHSTLMTMSKKSGSTGFVRLGRDQAGTL